MDIWTQSVLKPIHEYLFSILRHLPNDGTLDQSEAVNRCFEKSTKANCSYGYDLSAATDRLPLEIQKSVLSSLLGDKVADAWSSLLIDRDYTLKSQTYGLHTLRYAVGQPMGALSSFAMLALTHHLIVQWSARQALGKKIPMLGWYDNYELLGDDIVLFDSEVAKVYLSVMKSIGLEINESKSVIAVKAAFEFAKVTGLKGVDVSALS